MKSFCFKDSVSLSFSSKILCESLVLENCSCGWSTISVSNYGESVVEPIVALSVDTSPRYQNQKAARARDRAMCVHSRRKDRIWCPCSDAVSIHGISQEHFGMRGRKFQKRRIERDTHRWITLTDTTYIVSPRSTPYRSDPVTFFPSSFFAFMMKLRFSRSLKRATPLRCLVKIVFFKGLINIHRTNSSH